MSDVSEEVVDIPEPERALPEPAPDTAVFDPGGAEVPPPEKLPLGEDPAYDPGGMGRQPDLDEDDDDHR